VTGPQLKVLRYLVACEHASDKAVARMLWGSPRQHQRALGILHRLQDQGLVRPWGGPRVGAPRRSWCATAEGTRQAMATQDGAT
jgi:hypothetical protein